MPSLQIRELPSEIYETLAYRAKREGRSLAQQAIIDLRRVAELESQGRRMETIEELRNRFESNETRRDLPAPETLIREDRDR